MATRRGKRFLGLRTKLGMQQLRLSAAIFAKTRPERETGYGSSGAVWEYPNTGENPRSAAKALNRAA